MPGAWQGSVCERLGVVGVPVVSAALVFAGVNNLDFWWSKGCCWLLLGLALKLRYLSYRWVAGLYVQWVKPVSCRRSTKISAQAEAGL